MIRAVDRHLDLVGATSAGKLDFEVELRARQDFGAVDRIDGLGMAGGVAASKHAAAASNRRMVAILERVIAEA